MNTNKQPSSVITALVCGLCFGVPLAAAAIVATTQVMSSTRAPVIKSSTATFEQAGKGGVYRK